VALHDEFVARRVERCDRTVRLDVDIDFPRRRHVDRLAARQDIVEAVGVGRQDVVVGEGDFLDAAGRDREDARAHDVVARELEQGGVARASDDRVVDAARLLLGQQLRARLFALAHEIERMDCCAVGNREQHDRFGDTPSWVADGHDQPSARGAFEDAHVRLHLFDADGFGIARPTKGARLRDHDVRCGQRQ